jgi:HD superfamily phosphohydrolase YqeK/uncharacterized membrane protein required for colicin V production
MQKRVSLFVTCTCLAAVGILVWAFSALPGVGGSEYLKTAFLLALFGFAAEILAFSLPQGGVGSIAFIPFIAASLAVPTWASPLMIALAIAGGQIVQKRGLVKAVFNVSQTVVSLTAGIAVYRYFGGPALASLPNISIHAAASTLWLPATALLVVYIFLNTFLVSAVIAISSGSAIRQVWKANTLGTLSYYIITGPVAFLLAWSYVRAGPLGAVAVALPMLGVQQLYSITNQLRRTNQELLEMMVKAIEARDPYTSGHSRRVSNYSVVIARIIGHGDAAIERVRIAGLLHDVGKIHESFAPILRKPGKLTDEEWALMKTHPEKGAELIETLTHLRDLVPAIRHHHEQWSGGGYPDGLHGEQIPVTARIIMFADTMDAMLSDRPYRAALTEGEVRAELAKWKGVQFDPMICDALLRSVQFSELITAGVAKERARTTPPSMRAIAGRAMASVRSGAGT